MIISIANEHLSATFSTKGAELQQITGIDSGTAYLWSGDANYWAKFSPVLFPIVGTLKNNSYIHEGQTYHLSRHGFARDMEFEFEQISAHELLFTLTDSEESRKVYPFEFVLRLRYRLERASISCTYEVSNPAQEKDLIFSIGGHPAFAAPLNQQGVYSDYYLQFNDDDELTYYHLEEHLISDQTGVLKLKNRKLFLKHDLFYNDALVFKNLKSNSVSLMNTKNYNGLNFKFNDFPYFAIWAARDANFVCLEPWCGIADFIDHQQQLKDKEGVMTLTAGEHWKRSWEVTFF